MVRVTIAGVALDARGQHIILLKPTVDDDDGEVLLPIWIGEQEATSILIAVEGGTPPRPLSHDLMTSLVSALDAEIERVEVTRVDGGTFYAEITVRSPAGLKVLDARPSDAIALASRTGAPLWVADEVFEDAGIPGSLVQPEEDDETAVAEFRDFIEGVEPEDFQG
jgi:bifunctional DNase/RNase